MKIWQYFIFLVILSILSGCGHTAALRKQPPPGSYTIKGKTYSPLKQVRPGFFQDGVASWYGPGFHGKKTASGEVYDMHGMTAAHSILPLNTIVKVANLKNGQEVVVRVNDRGPFIGDRVIDLSFEAARKLGIVAPGTMPVRVSVLGPGDTRLASRLSVPSVEKKGPRAPKPYYKTPNPYYKKGTKKLLALK
jgi:rare lipoprotein A